MATKRIIELTEGAVASGDYVITDSATSGTKKVDLQAALDAASADPASSTPLMDGTAAVGTSDAYARGDHRHPTDTSRAPLASPALTGTPTAPTAAAGTSTTQIATTAFVAGAVHDRRAANVLKATIDGTLVTADDAAPTTPIDATVYGQSTQDGTPTPESPVPIVSVEGDEDGNISLWARGKNLADPTFPRFTYAAARGVTYTKAADGTITASGTASALAYLSFSSSTENPFGLILGETYTISTTSTSGKIYALTTGGSSASLPYTFEYGDGDYSVGVAVKNNDTVDESFKVMLQHGSTATAYQPYTETVTPIDLDGHELRSLPDGTRDELTVDAEGHVTLVQRVGAATFDGTESWTKSSSRNIYYTPVYIGATVPNSSMSACCDHATWDASSLANMADGTFKVTYVSGGTNEYFYIVMESITSMDDFKTWLASNNVTVLFKLPDVGITTHDLGTVPLAPLVGPDLTAQTVPTAPLALTYERDATIVLDRLTAMWANVAPVEGDTASANYSVGSYLMHGGQLCRVTTAIATGETISIGTNVTATTVMAEVIALTQ